MQGKEVFSDTANDDSIPIDDDVILQGTGRKDTTIGEYKNYCNSKAVDFGEMDLTVGLNKVVLTYSKESSVSYPSMKILESRNIRMSTTPTSAFPQSITPQKVDFEDTSVESK